MTIDRRHLMTAAAAVGAMTALPAARAGAQSPTPRPSQQAPAFQRRSVGDATVTGLADGFLPLGPGAFPDVDEAAFIEAMREAYLPADPSHVTAVNAYLVEVGGRTVLIDAGGSTALAPSLGNLLANLSAAGVEPGNVDAVLLTHMHPDHVGHLANDGVATFPNAELVVHAAEVTFWRDPATRSAMPEARRGMVDAANAAIAPYEDRTTLFEGDVEVLAGIAARHLPGHTPGHTGYRVGSGDDTLLIWGDIVHVAPVQLPQPTRAIGFDVDPEQAVATRQRLLDEVTSDRTLIAGMHLSFPGFGHIMPVGQADNAYAFIPTRWEYNI
ncbi:MBL fold metallo-hydrolase [Acuticoccus sp.]|uniref:MBL fold metallo-hydrolase n=1 Tax=Acuticoccus sp. TaxID=1904378 RepID=UPI003B52880E